MPDMFIIFVKVVLHHLTVWNRIYTIQHTGSDGVERKTNYLDAESDADFIDGRLNKYPRQA